MDEGAEGIDDVPDAGRDVLGEGRAVEVVVEEAGTVGERGDVLGEIAEHGGGCGVGGRGGPEREGELGGEKVDELEEGVDIGADGVERRGVGHGGGEGGEGVGAGPGHERERHGADYVSGVSSCVLALCRLAMFKLGLGAIRACRRTSLLALSPGPRPRPAPRPPAFHRTVSFFPWSTSTPPPSLDTAAEIAALEAHANASPNDLPKQLAFFNALLATRTKQGYDTLIDRWELSERVSLLLSRSRLAHRPRRTPPPSSTPTRPLKYTSTHSPAPAASHP